MADGYARVSGRLGVASVHQGPGLTNAITGLTEAAKSRTPLVLLAADTPAAQLRSNFKIDQDALVESVGAVAERVHGPATAVADVTRAVRRAVVERRAVVLMLPLDVQAADGRAHRAACRGPSSRRCGRRRCEAVADAAGARRAARDHRRARRGAVRRGPGAAAPRRAQRRGPGDLRGRQRAVRRTTRSRSASRAGSPRRTAQRLLAEADVIVAFGASLNMWTTRHGALRRGRARSCRSTATRRRSARTGRSTSGVVGDARETAEALIAALTARAATIPDLGGARRSVALAAEIAGGAWRDEPYEPSREWLDPRDLSIALDDLLPAERTVVVDSGAFMGYPSMYLRVPDAAGLRLPAGVPVRRARRSATRSAPPSRGRTG